MTTRLLPIWLIEPKKTATQMKDQNFNSKEPISKIACVQDFRVAGDTCNVHEKPQYGH